MSVKAYYEDYKYPAKDRQENFHGNQLVYVNWDKHLLFAAPFTLMVSPAISFRSLRDEVMPNAFNQHPEWTAIDWQKVHWLLNGEPFTPQLECTLVDQGITHKSFLRIQTPELTGISAAGI
ncbi:phenol hydroxylase subunit P4 [Halioxenophilus sp. WMMB6]|uniref:phenol hydroxylase subunit P4 n=1 Tax=Halioxenophilus sp. WMMB6 TaxID=3073815 RepID=UPI00295EF491|nr:phenol hydroxylase subunit P4 [Halioxenophilus sp. WMMB6]